MSNTSTMMITSPSPYIVDSVWDQIVSAFGNAVPSFAYIAFWTIRPHAHGRSFITDVLREYKYTARDAARALECTEFEVMMLEILACGFSSREALPIVGRLRHYAVEMTQQGDAFAETSPEERLNHTLFARVQAMLPVEKRNRSFLMSGGRS